MSQITRARLLAALADGRFHSGQTLAEQAGISRTAVWKHVRSLRKRGLDIFAVSGRGYRLAEPLDLLIHERINAGLDQRSRAQISELNIVHETPSTNQYILDRLSAKAAHGHVCLAEYQSAGRGRHGRQWSSPIAAGLYLSIGWYVDGMAEPLTGLSLAAGVAMVRALNTCGITGVSLKWPNDIIADGRKLGGILLQVRGEITGPCLWVLGVGVNVRLPATALAAIDQPATDLATLAASLPPRSVLAAAMLNELLACLRDYPRTGFKPYVRDWQRFDCMSGRQVTLAMANRRIRGRMVGVDSAGALLLSIDGRIQRYASGELSLREAS